MAVGTGHGATFTIGGSAVANIRQITGEADTMPTVDASHLGTTGPRRAYVPADLADSEPMSMELLFDGEADLLALGGAPAEGVLTYKQQPGETAPANRTGNGWLVRRKYPDQVTNEMSLVEYDWMWEDEPTFTPATIV